VFIHNRPVVKQGQRVENYKVLIKDLSTERKLWVVRTRLRKALSSLVHSFVLFVSFTWTKSREFNDLWYRRSLGPNKSDIMALGSEEERLV
jgi:hypothetical protein